MITSIGCLDLYLLCYDSYNLHYLTQIIRLKNLNNKFFLKTFKRVRNQGGLKITCNRHQLPHFHQESEYYNLVQSPT